jgi:hypothetical protein
LVVMRADQRMHRAASGAMVVAPTPSRDAQRMNPMVGNQDGRGRALPTRINLHRDAPGGENCAYERKSACSGTAGSMPQAIRQSEADTRQKSTARRFVSSCSVQ